MIKRLELKTPNDNNVFTAVGMMLRATKDKVNEVISAFNENRESDNLEAIDVYTKLARNTRLVDELIKDNPRLVELAKRLDDV